MKLSTVPLNAIQHVLIYGAPKTGKTELVGKLAETHKLIWFDCENGFKTLQKMPVAWQENVELIQIPDTRAWPVAIETLLKVFNGTGPVAICEAHGKVSCPRCTKEGLPTITVDASKLDASSIIVIDTLSQVATSCMNNITKNEVDDYKMQRDDYMRQGMIMGKLLTNIQQARCNVVCISHEIDVSKENDPIKLSAMSGTTNFSKNTGSKFDHVVYCEIKNKNHSFGSSTTFSNVALAGSRLDVATEKMGEPSLAPIFDGGWKAALEEGQKKETLSALERLKLKK